MTTSYSTAAARRIVTTLFVAQSLGAAALIANSTINPIVGAGLSGRDDLAGLPGTLLLLGAAGAAHPAGRLMERLGRRRGLVLGFVAGLMGMAIGGAAIVARSFPLFLLGLLLIGGARGAVDQSRYAAADAELPERRARAISTVVFAGTIGAIAGPALVAPSGAMLAGLGVAPLSGPMWVGALLFALAAGMIGALLRPDPRDVARAIAAASPGLHRGAGQARPLREVMLLPAARLALASMVTGQVVMVLIMSVTSLHMHHHHHGLDAVALVITAHTIGMYGLSIASGALVDRLGRRAAIAAGAALLIAGSLLAPTSAATAWLALALFLVGLGWNLCYIAGSSLLADALAPSDRARTQGVNEVVVNLASAASSLCSGLILGHLGYGALGLVGALLALVPLVVMGWQGLARVRSLVGSDAAPAGD